MLRNTHGRVIVSLAALVLAATAALPAIGGDPGSAGGLFALTGSLAEARSGHTATGLPDGRVLVIGGRGERKSDVAAPASAEIWDPATGSFSQSGSLAHPRIGHTATRLSDGRVLVIGGADGNVPAELWDPATGSFQVSGMPTVMRTGHTATALPDGRVLVAGGYGGEGMIAHAELWDPVTGTFTANGTLHEVRSHHSATLLPDGRVLLVAGDSDLVFRDSAELWDPATESFASTGSLDQARWWHTATLLPDGAVLIVGGLGWDEGPLALATTERWDPATGEFDPAVPLAAGRAWHAAAPLSSGQVLVVGGARVTETEPPGYVAVDSAELLDSSTSRSVPAGNLAEARAAGHTATPLLDGRVLVVGGVPTPWPAGGSHASAEMWRPR